MVFMIRCFDFYGRTKYYLKIADILALDWLHSFLLLNIKTSGGGSKIPTIPLSNMNCDYKSNLKSEFMCLELSNIIWVIKCEVSLCCDIH